MVHAPNPWRPGEYEGYLRKLRESGHLGEAEIIWLEEPDTFVYVREALIVAPSPTRKPGKPPHSRKRVVAYSTLERGTPSAPDSLTWNGRLSDRKTYYRRVWYVMPWDPYEPWNPKLGGPMEAVDPESIRPNETSSRPGHDLRDPGVAGQRKADVEAKSEGTFGVRRSDL